MHALGQFYLEVDSLKNSVKLDLQKKGGGGLKNIIMKRLQYKNLIIQIKVELEWETESLLSVILKLLKECWKKIICLTSATKYLIWMNEGSTRIGGKTKQWFFVALSRPIPNQKACMIISLIVQLAQQKQLCHLRSFSRKHFHPQHTLPRDLSMPFMPNLQTTTWMKIYFIASFQNCLKNTAFGEKNTDN